MPRHFATRGRADRIARPCAFYRAVMAHRMAPHLHLPPYPLFASFSMFCTRQ
jgi:hypothetical protein